MQGFDFKFQKMVINKCVSLLYVLDSLGIDYSTTSVMFCPFHDDVNHPSAKIYEKDGIYKLWCYTEHRFYDASDALFYLKGIKTKDFFNKLWLRLPKDIQSYFLSYKLPTKSEGDEFLQYLSLFSKGKISFQDYLTYLERSCSS